MFLGLVYTALGLVTAFVVQRLVDDFIPGGHGSRIIAAGGILLGLQLLYQLSYASKSLCCNYLDFTEWGTYGI